MADTLAPPAEARDRTRADDPLRALCAADPVFAARYVGWDVLGHGSRSVVVRTHLRDAGVALAVKLFYPLADSERRLFRGEAQAMMGVVHRSVLRTFGVVDRGPLAWLELELIDGTTLAAALAHCAETGAIWPLASALEIAASLAEGLAAVHAAGFVHRDVKPANVLLPRERYLSAKLGDFGIARSLEATQQLDEALLGSPAYLCPEAEQGQAPTPAGDVYALAVTLYELLGRGAYPYRLRSSQPSLAEIRECHRRAPPTSLRLYAPDLPMAVADVIHLGLSKRPSERPTAAEMAAALRAAQGLPPAVRTADTTSPPRHCCDVLLPLLSGTLVGVGLLAAAFVWLLFA